MRSVDGSRPWVCGYTVQRVGVKQRGWRRWVVFADGPGLIGRSYFRWTERGAHHTGSRLALAETLKYERVRAGRPQTFIP